MLNQKGNVMAIAFIIAGVLLLGAGTLFAYSVMEKEKADAIVVSIPVVQKTNNTTSDWKTYTNSQYHFSFKYPKDWVLVEDKFDPQADNPFTSDTISVHDPKDNSVAFSVCPDKRGNDCLPFQDGIWSPTYNNVVIAGFKGLETTFTLDPNQNCPSCSKVSTIISLTNKPLGWKVGNSQSWQDDRDFRLAPGKDNSSTPQQILSTFNFTDQTTDWKTYTNSKWGYSIKYPKDFSIDQTRTTEDRVNFQPNPGTELLEAIEVKRFDQPLSDWPKTLEETPIKITNLKVAGVDAIRIDTHSFMISYIGVKKGNNLYVFTSNNQMFKNGMMDTVQFTN